MSDSEEVGPSRRDYSGTMIAGQATVHQGDQHYHFPQTNGAQRAPLHLQAPEGNKLGLLLRDAPQIESKLFVGRRAELQQLLNILGPNEQPASQQKVVLGGMGGVGKTQLAIAYAKQYQHLYDSVLWLNATSEALLRDSIRSVALMFEESGNVSAYDDAPILAFFSRWLSQQGNTRWLLILDNYDNPELYDIRRFLPVRSQGSIIITTRLTGEVAERCACPKIHLQPLTSVGEALKVLATRSGREIHDSDQAARRLVERFQGLPLALATAGAYLRSTPITFQQYLDAYETRWTVSKKTPKPLAEYDSRTLYTTWDISYEQLLTTSPDAASILRLLAYFDNERISHDHLRTAAVCPDCCTPASWMKETIGSDICFADAMRDLVNFSFLDLNVRTGEYSMHNCIHDWTLECLNKDVSTANFWFAISCVAHPIRDEDFDDLSRPEWRPLMAHAARLSHRRFLNECVSADEPSSQRQDVDRICDLLRAQAQYDAAIQIAQRLLVLHQEAGESQSLRIAELYHFLGVSYMNAGKYGKAEENFQRALQGRRKQLGAQALPTLRTTYHLGRLYMYRRDYDNAEVLLRRAYEGLKSAPDGGPRHEYTLDAVGRLADIYKRQGRLDEAEKLIRRALNGHENETDLEICPLVIVGLVYQLVWVYIGWGSREKLEDAERLSERLLKTHERRYGPLHRVTLTAVGTMAELHRRQGRLQEAEDESVRAVKGRSQVLGHDHPNTLIARYNLALLYKGQERWAEAREIIEDVARERKRILGTEHPDVYDDLRFLGEVYHMQGELDKAEEAFRQALNMAKQMVDSQQKVVAAERWLKHVQKTRANGGVCRHLSQAGASGQKSATLRERKAPGKPSARSKSASNFARPPKTKSFFQSMKKIFSQ